MDRARAPLPGAPLSAERTHGAGAGGCPAEELRGLRGLAVDAAQVRPLRGALLRPGQPVEQLVFAGDEAPDTLHAALMSKGRPVAVASVMRNPFPPAGDAHDWRVRGMATLPDLRGRGLGGRLLACCAAHAREHEGRRLWCNARVGARAFYERGGMTVVGERFELPTIGWHYLMVKALVGG